MRKQITTTLKFSELDKMTFHEVIRMMGFSFNNFNEVPESVIRNDIKRLPCPIEFNKKDITFNDTIRESKIFLIIYLFIYRAKFGAKRYDSWYDVMKTLYNTIGTENSVFTTETNIIKWKDSSIIIDIDKNAFINPSEEFKLLRYDNVHIYEAPKHLAIITGFGIKSMMDFCGEFFDKLADEVKSVGDYFRQREDWCFKQFCHKFNYDNPSHKLFLPNNMGVKSIYLSEYFYYLLFIKTVNGWDASRKILKKYLESNNPYDIENKRIELLKYFYEIVKVYDPQMSFCYEEHLFALKNYFKAEYVLNIEKTPSGIDTEQYNLSAVPTKETNTVNALSKEKMIDLRNSGEEPNPLNITKVNRSVVDNDPSDFVSIANKQIELYKKKNRDYGNATDILYKKHGFTYYQIMLEQKMQRIDSITKNNKEHNFESLEDSLLDLSNYAILAVESLRKEKQGKQ